MAQGSTKVKHFDVKFDFLKDLVKSRIIHLEYILSADQVADTLKKQFQKYLFQKYEFYSVYLRSLTT